MEITEFDTGKVEAKERLDYWSTNVLCRMSISGIGAKSGFFGRLL